MLQRTNEIKRNYVVHIVFQTGSHHLYFFIYNSQLWTVQWVFILKELSYRTQSLSDICIVIIQYSTLWQSTLVQGGKCKWHHLASTRILWLSFSLTLVGQNCTTLNILMGYFSKWIIWKMIKYFLEYFVLSTFIFSRILSKVSQKVVFAQIVSYKLPTLKRNQISLETALILKGQTYTKMQLFQNSSSDVYRSFKTFCFWKIFTFE